MKDPQDLEGPASQRLKKTPEVGPRGDTKTPRSDLGGNIRLFPKGFLWGASTASYQVEGGIENNDWAEAAREGRVPPCGRACDHYNRFEQDFDLAVNLGHNAHRFSIEWARIEPHEGVFDEKEIEHYRQVLRALKARGLEPIVTLHHWTEPLWFTHSGGFLRKDSAAIFARYCARVVRALGGDARLWITLNEPEVITSNAYLRGKWPPFKKSPIVYLRMLRALMDAHSAAYAAMKEVRGTIRIGIATHQIDFDPAHNPFHRGVARFLTWFWNHRFIERTIGAHDFIGLNHYFHHPLGKRVRKDAPRSDMQWEVHPQSLYRVIMGLRSYKLPIYITENGLADEKDVLRERYILGHVGAVHDAIRDGADVRGYLHWSLMDNYEWAEGFWPRFGLIAIDYNTLTRSIRPSARVYEDICRKNALPEIPA